MELNSNICLVMVLQVQLMVVATLALAVAAVLAVAVVRRVGIMDASTVHREESTCFKSNCVAIGLQHITLNT